MQDRIVRRERFVHDEAADMGIGTLIMFIAVVLVAAIAAALLIQSAIVLKEDGERLQSEAITYISSGFDVVDIVGDRQIYGNEPYNLTAMMDPGDEIRPGGEGIEITWENPSGVSVTGYRIYRDLAPSWSAKQLLYDGQGGGEVTSFLDRGNEIQLGSYTTYSYRVSIYSGTRSCGLSEPAEFTVLPYHLNAIRNAGNNRGANSHQDFPHTDATQSRPLALTVEFDGSAGSSSVILNWTYPELVDDITGFRVFRGDSENNLTLLHTSTTKPPLATFTDTGAQVKLEPERYFYRIAALTSRGSTLPSEAGSTSLSALQAQAIADSGGNTGSGTGQPQTHGTTPAPLLHGLVINGNGITISWSSTMNEIDAVTVYRSDDDDAIYRMIYNSSTASDPAISHFIDNGAQRVLRSGFADSYIVQIHNASTGWSGQLLVPLGGVSENSIYAMLRCNTGHDMQATPPATDRSYSRPVEPTLQGTDGGVTLRWRYPLGAEYPASYRIYRGSSANTETLLFISDISSEDVTGRFVESDLYQTWTDHGDQEQLEAGTYYYRISYTGASGNSMATFSVAVTVNPHGNGWNTVNRGGAAADLLHRDIQVLKVKVILRPGSRNISLESTQLTLFTGKEDMHLFLDNDQGNPGGALSYRAEALTDPANIFTKETKYTVSRGTLVVLYVNVGEAGLNLELETQDYVKMQILPSNGVKSIELFTMPDVFVGRFIMIEN